ncbi:MAG TPA: hypothetical protein VMS74_10835 [Acidimicrobiia bacterium]|nr:hypothetical protein [Acidimicrobiia bacterium]
MKKSNAQWAAALVFAAASAVVLPACGDLPLEGVGVRSEAWIGPIAEDVQLLPETRSEPELRAVAP